MKGKKEKKPGQCPFCHSLKGTCVEYDDTIDGQHLVVGLECMDCEKNWTEKFKLVGWDKFVGVKNGR